MKRILSATLLSAFLSGPVMSTHQPEEEALEVKPQSAITLSATTQKNTKKKDKKKNSRQL